MADHADIQSQTATEVTYLIRLPPSGAGGYLWAPVSLPAGCRLEEAGAEPAAGPAIGAPEAMTFRLTCPRPPPAAVEFRLARPWEPRALRRLRVALPPPG